MKLQIEKRLLLCLCLLISSSGWAQNLVFHETFDSFSKTGGNDDVWKNKAGSGSEITRENWEMQKVFPANKCVKIGTGGVGGFIMTPTLDGLKGDATLAIKAGAWDGASEKLTIAVSLEGGGTVSPASFTLVKGAFNSYQATITGGTPSTRIKIAASEAENNRFFLDDIKVETGGVQPPTVKEAGSMAELLTLADDTPIRLTLSKDNRGNILEAKGKEEAYVRDTHAAVRFKNFLTTDRGWHPVTGGELVGVIEGRFTKQDGVPTIVPNAASDARKFLCLDFVRKPEASVKEISEILSNKQLRANLVKLQGVQIKKEGERIYAATGSEKIELQEHLHALNPRYSQEAYGGRTFNLEAIVGTKGEDTPVLYYVSAEEVKIEVALDEATDNTATLALNDGKRSNVTVKRTLLPDMWNTLCLPFDLDLADTELGDAQLAKLKSYDAETQTLNFETALSIEAGVPYLIFVRQNLLQIEGHDVSLNKTLRPQSMNGCEFQGIYAPTTFAADDRNVFFLGRDNNIHYPSTHEALRAFRAYFRFDGSEAPVSRFTVDGKEYEVTAIADFLLEPHEKETPAYDLSGRQINDQPAADRPQIRIKKKQKQLYP